MSLLSLNMVHRKFPRVEPVARTSWSDLPMEVVVQYLLPYLAEAVTLARFGTTCKEIKGLTLDDEETWKVLLEQRQ